MAHSEVLLIQPVDNLGAEGDQVKVRAGYARNFLLPRKLAVPVTASNRKQIEALRQARTVREARDLEAARELADRVSKTAIAIAVKTGEGGKMFGAVTAAEVIARLTENGIELDRKQVLLPQPIKTVGRHAVTIKLHPEVSVDLELDVVSENPIQDTEAAAE